MAESARSRRTMLRTSISKASGPVDWLCKSLETLDLGGGNFGETVKRQARGKLPLQARRKQAMKQRRRRRKL